MDVPLAIKRHQRRRQAVGQRRTRVYRNRPVDGNGTIYSQVGGMSAVTNSQVIRAAIGDGTAERIVIRAENLQRSTAVEGGVAAVTQCAGQSLVKAAVIVG